MGTLSWRMPSYLPLFTVLIIPYYLVKAGPFTYGKQHLPAWMNSQAISTRGFGRFTKAEDDTDILDNPDLVSASLSPRTASLLMVPEKRPSPSQLEVLKRLYNVEMVRRLSGGLFDMSYLSDMAEQNERQQHQQLEEIEEEEKDDALAPRSSQALRLPKGPVMQSFGLTSPYVSIFYGANKSGVRWEHRPVD